MKIKIKILFVLAFMAVACADRQEPIIVEDFATVQMQVDPMVSYGFEALSTPATVSNFHCMALNVTGGGIPEASHLGLLSSQVSLMNGGVMSVDVPKADGLSFQVIGLTSTVGCPGSAKINDFLSTTHYPILTELGKKIVDVKGDMDLEIVSTYNSSNAVDVRTGSALTAAPSAPKIGDAPIRPSGTLGTFVHIADLPVAHEHAASIQVGSKIYLIGGNIGASPDPTSIGLSAGATTGILEATIDQNGSPSAFTKSTFTLAVGRKGARAEVIGNYVYIFGGFTAAGQTTTTPLTSIERATIDSNGLTSSFSVISETLAVGRYNFLTLVTPGYVYAIGGGISSSYHSNTIERAPLNVDTGVIGNFVAMTRTVVSASEVTNGLVDDRWTHNGIRLGNNFYILGGEGIATIEKVEVNADGTIGNFVKLAGTLTSSRNRLSIIALAGRAYVFGGWSGTFLTSVESAPITNNELGAFSVQAGVTLAFGVENGTSLLTNTGVYLFGGSSGGVQRYIQRAPINPVMIFKKNLN